MQFPQNPHPHWAQNGRISTIRFHNLKYLEGNCMRNLSPADERRPQGLRAHIHTFTMRAFSDSSANKYAHCGPSRSSSAENSPSTPPLTACAVQNSPSTPPVSSISGTKLSLLAQNGPIWRVLPMHGELSTAVATNKQRRASLFTHADRTGRAGEFLLRAQPPLRLGILPLTSTPPSWRRPSSAGKINIQPPTSAPTIRR